MLRSGSITKWMLKELSLSIKIFRLFMEIMLLLYQQVDERGQERLSSFSDVVNELKKSQIERQLVL
jgi:hypothetical protein